MQIYSTTTFGINSFRCEEPKIWNYLPEYLKDANQVGEFKQLLQSGQVQSANAKIVINVMWTAYSDMYMTTTLHLIGITMFESYSFFHILAVTKHQTTH